jgi:hypothetical protein
MRLLYGAFCFDSGRHSYLLLAPHRQERSKRLAAARESECLKTGFKNYNKPTRQMLVDMIRDATLTMMLRGETHAIEAAGIVQERVEVNKLKR